MNKETQKLYHVADRCHICNKPCSDKIKKERDHYHIGLERGSSVQDYSNFRRAACNSCNLSFQEPKFIPVIFHNLRGFDGHILFQRMGKLKIRVESYCTKYGTLCELFHLGFTLS